MDKKRNMVLVIVATVTLLVSVVGATFAYFSASTATGTNTSALTATTESNSSQITLNKSCNMTTSISAVAMNSDNGSSAGTAINGTQCSLTATASSSQKQVCNYKVTYTKTSATSFSYSAANTTKKAEYALVVTRTVGSGLSVTGAATSPVDITTASSVVIDKGVITINANTTNALLKYDITPRFYNYDFDQSTNAGKTVEGTVKIIVTGCSFAETPNTNDPFDFEADSWATIQKAVQDGTASNYYNVGDTKTITIASHTNDCPTYTGAGTSDSPRVCGVATTTPEQTLTVRIANMSTPSECSNSDFSQTACGFVVEFVDIIENHVFNPGGLDTANGISSNEYKYGSSRGGYPASSIYSFINGTLYDAFPQEVKDVMITTKVVSGYGSRESNKSNFTSNDKLYLLDSKEIYGTSFISSYNKAKDYERQLDYYNAVGVTTSNYSGAIKKLGTTSSHWWLRSAYSGDSYYFWLVFSSGNSINNRATIPIGLSAAFRVG